MIKNGKEAIFINSYEELVKRLRNYSEKYVTYKIDADFASAVQEAANTIGLLASDYNKAVEKIKIYAKCSVCEFENTYDECEPCFSCKESMCFCNWKLKDEI